MYVSLCRVTAGRDLDWPAFVALAGNAGYDAVDMELEAVRRDGVSATLDLLAKYKLKPAVCGHWVEIRRDDVAFRESMRELDTYVRLATEIGCPRMVTWVPPTYDQPGDTMRQALRQRFAEVAKVMNGRGVRLGLEFITPLHFRTAVPTEQICIWQMSEMLSLCEACGDNVGLLLDSWHWHHDPDRSIQAIIDAGRERIVHVHLNDSPDLPPDEIRDSERLLPGEGVIDLRGFLNALRHVGYSEAVSLEVFGRLDKLPADVAATQALAAARKVMA